ncbi:hypothetical protein M501DRAFT_671112 [Patellaria atrata CBS 101060]|uniref:Uncharacterized protein n=1 Tax=Patellaria atrata CBS 101060 TaxID=1346257 RepID=A0A9P4SC99_9PEZI|nr:hypothetical protein M501DRAFT_671112 [Patellaria atrata CBS 101060]
MDSMRSLNTSLPVPSSPKKPTTHPPEQLLQAFKSAALSVTNLYKTAAADQARAHAEGYQEALEDLIGFLDSKNLGLGDGEGWKVRQWATERLNGAVPTHSTSDSDEETEEDKRARSSSPILQGKPSLDPPQTNQTLSLPSPDNRSESAPPAAVEQNIKPTFAMIPSNSEFTYRSNINYPSYHDIDMETNTSPSSANTNSSPPVRLEVFPRPIRSSARINNRQNSRATTLGAGAGAKRKVPFNEYFDISGLHFPGPQGGAGHKKGRFI